MNPQWVGLIVTVLVALGGTAANLFLMGRFVGQWGEAMKNNVAALAKVEARLEDVEDRTDETENRRALMEPRLQTVESGVDRFWAMRDEFVTMRTTVEIEGKHAREKLEAVARGMAVIERQLGNLVTTKAGFTTLTSEDKN